MVKIVRVLGMALLICGCAFILYYVAAAFYYRGLSGLISMLNPFNITHYLASVAALMPGILLLVLADKLESTRSGAKNGGGY